MQDGDRVLTEAEWALFRPGLDLLRDSIEEDISAETDDTETGIPVFDRLTPEQKLSLLADTAQALRDPAVPMPHQTAANEGAIMAVFSTLRMELESELDVAETETDDRPTEIRRLLRAACDGTEDREEPLPDLQSTDSETWGWLLEEVEVRIFWDYDFDMGDAFLDLPPDEAQEKLQAFGIDPEYYLVVPAEPDEAALISARQTLARLLGLPVPGDDGLYSALDDLYHDLTVGPCSPEEVASWEGNPWVDHVGMSEPGWDCDYITWTAHFSRAVPAVPFQLNPASAGDVQEEPHPFSVERNGDSWVVRDKHGYYWCGLVENGWTGPDDGMSALTFPSEAEARAAYAQAERMYAERAARHRAASAQLGLPECD